MLMAVICLLLGLKMLPKVYTFQGRTYWMKKKLEKQNKTNPQHGALNDYFKYQQTLKQKLHVTQEMQKCSYRDLG